MSIQPEKDEHGCVKGIQKWNGTKCVAVDPEKKTQEATTPDPVDYHKKRTRYRAPISTPAAVKAYRTPTQQGQIVERKGLISFIKSKRKTGLAGLRKKAKSETK